MDYLDPDKKRQHTQRLFIGYGLMAVLIGLGTILLVLFAYGFSFDRSTGSIIQNGLVFVDTNPVASNVYIDGELRGRGDQRLVLPSGDYSIEIQEPGYRSWHKDISLLGGSLLRFSYPLLIPEDVETSVYRRFDAAPNILSTSPDRRWLLLQESSQVDAFVLYDLNQGINLPTFFSLPVGVLEQEVDNSELTIVEWSNDNRHVIVKHSFDGGEEFVLLDIDEPNRSQNLTDRFSNIPFTDISLVDKQFDQYHLFNRSLGVLQRAGLEQDDPSIVLEDIITYRSHGDDALVYAKELPVIEKESTDDIQRKAVGIFMSLEDRTYQIDALPKAPASDYLLDIAQFDESWYVVIGFTGNKQALVYRDPVALLEEDQLRTLLPVTTLRTEGEPTYVSFSGNARNIALQAGTEFSVYDAEREQSHTFRVNDQEAIPRAQWMDGHRLVYIQNEEMYVIDFDGTNQQSIAECLPGYQPLFDTEYRFSYCIGSPDDSDRFGLLHRLSLRVEE